MKKLILTLAGLMIMVWCSAAVCRAEKVLGTCGANGDNVSFAIEDNGSLHIYGSGEMVRSSVWNDYLSFINTVVIYPSVTNIGWNAFSGFENLTAVIFYENNVAKIDAYAFENCCSLTEITLPSSVTSIGSSAFSGCTSLTAVSMPDSVTSIGTYAFENCSSLAGITLPSGLTYLGGTAFSGCTSLTSITIPDRVTSIEGSTFRGCTGLTGVTLPEGLTSVGAYAFYNCSSLKNLIFPDTLKRINMYAFAGCSSFTNVELPAAVNSIGNNAFSGDTVANAMIPGEYVSFGSGIFSGAPTIYCYEGSPADSWGQQNEYPVVYMDHISGNDYIRTIAVDSLIRLNTGDTAYLNVDVFPYSDAPAVVFGSLNPSVASVHDGLVAAEGAGTARITASVGNGVSAVCKVVVVGEFTSILILPEDLTTIGAEALSGLESAEAVRIPESVGEIADDAFDNSSIVILAPEGSYAVQWAEAHGVPHIES